MAKVAIHHLNVGMFRHLLYPDLVCTKMLQHACRGLWERDFPLSLILQCLAFERDRHTGQAPDQKSDIFLLEEAK